MATETVAGTKIPLHEYRGQTNESFVFMLRVLLPIVKAGTWTEDTVEEIRELRDLIEYLRNGVEKLRKGFDDTLYECWDDGTIDKTGENAVASIRARSEFVNGKPGRKAKSVDDILAEL